MTSRRDQLVAEVKARHRAAGKKISRIESKGININGGSFDPRVKHSSIESMTTAELRRYLSKLNKFVSRETQFVPDSHRRPLPMTDWKKFLAVQKKANEARAEYYAKFKDIQVPHGNKGDTISAHDLLRMMTPSRPWMQDMSAENFMRPLNKSPRSINGQINLKRAIKETEKIFKNKTYFDKKQRQAKDIYMKMQKSLNDPELDKIVKGLSAKQFAFLWHFTKFAHNLAGNYAAAKMGFTVNEDRHDSQEWQDRMVSQEHQEAIKWAKFAKTLKF